MLLDGINAIKACHHKDGHPHQHPHEGDIPVETILHYLKEQGYDGYLSFEWEKKWHPELPDPEVAFPAYIEYIRKVW